MSRVFARLDIFRRWFYGYSVDRGSYERGLRWATAADKDPALIEDLIIMGEIIQIGPMDENNTLKATDLELAYDRGRRDLALDLLAMMNLTPYELNKLMKETPHETRRPD